MAVIGASKRYRATIGDPPELDARCLSLLAPGFDGRVTIIDLTWINAKISAHKTAALRAC